MGELNWWSKQRKLIMELTTMMWMKNGWQYEQNQELINTSVKTWIFYHYTVDSMILNRGVSALILLNKTQDS